MLTTIKNEEDRSFHDELVDKLNVLIVKYNNNPDVLMLQRIDGLAQQIFRVHRASPNQLSSSFMKWLFRDEVGHELSKLANVPELLYTNKKLFLDLTPTTKDKVPTLQIWQKQTTKGIFFKEARDPVFVKVDNYLNNIFSGNQEDGSYDLAKLEVLQGIIIDTLNNDLYGESPLKIEKFCCNSNPPIFSINHSLQRSVTIVLQNSIAAFLP